MTDPTACDKYELPEANLRMCTRAPNIDGHNTSQSRLSEPQGLQRRSLSRKDNDRSSSSSSSSEEDGGNSNRPVNKTKKYRRKCTRMCLILVAIVMVLVVAHTTTNMVVDKPSLSYMPSWNNYT